MLRPFLFVGCGGSGVKTIRLLKQAIEFQLRSRGYTDPLPESWQFLGIDVPAVEDSPSELMRVSGVTYVGLADPHATYRGANGADSRLMGNPNSRAEFHQWRPDPDGVHTNIVVGAGQQRAVGRVVASVFNGKVAPKIKQAAERCTATRGELLELAEKLDYHNRLGDQPAPPIVVLVSSLGGGAGSGIFLDVADMLRMSAEANDTWLQNNLFSVLYDPSVFDRDGSVLESGIAPNSLAAISELVAGQWSPWSRSALLADFQGELGNYAGIEYPFLVGSSNGSVVYSDPVDVYRATAQALCAWVLDPDLAATIESFGAGNWSTKSAKSSLPLHGGAATRMPLSALGFSRVGLGRRRFGSYVEERLSREAVERMLTLHHTQAVHDGILTDAEAAEARVSADDYSLVVQALKQCGLDEHTNPEDFSKPGLSIVEQMGIGSNQVLSAIRDYSGMTDSVSRIREDVVKAMNDPKMMAGQAENAVATYFEGEPDKFLERHKSRALVWAAEIQPKVIDGVLQLIATEGLPVATLVVKEMINRVGTTTPEQLLNENILLEGLSTWKMRRDMLSKIKVRGKSIPETAKDTVRALFESHAVTEIEKGLRLVVAPLLRDLANGFLAPLHREMVNALASAREERTTETFRNLAADVVPTRLHPAPNETLLDDVKTFPKLYLDLLRKTSGSVEAALSDVLQGLYGSERSRVRAPEDTLPVHFAPWVPRLAQEAARGGVAAAASFNFRLGAQQIRRRANYWIGSDVQTPVGRFMRTSLREYLSDASVTDAERQTRAKEFARSLELALDSAKPLAELANQWVANSFNVDHGNTFEFLLTAVPLAPGDNGYEEVAAVLKKRLNRLDVSSQFSTSTTSEVEIFSLLRPLAPSAFASLVFPITRAWGSEIADFPRGNGTFWRHRRARPLLDALPLTNAVRNTLARGWTTGLLLGLINWSPADDQITIDSADGKRLSFTKPPVSGTPADERDQFAAILESTMLAEFLAAAGQPESLAALEELLRLGNAFDRAEASLDYEGVNPRLAEFIKASGDDPNTVAREFADELLAGVKDIEDSATAERRNPEAVHEPLRSQIAPLQVRAIRDIAAQLETFSLAKPESGRRRIR